MCILYAGREEGVQSKNDGIVPISGRVGFFAQAFPVCGTRTAFSVDHAAHLRDDSFVSARLVGVARATEADRALALGGLNPEDLDPGEATSRGRPGFVPAERHTFTRPGASVPVGRCSAGLGT